MIIPVRFPRAPLLALMLFAAAPRPVAAQSFSPYATFQSLSDARLAGLQIKFSYQGATRYPARTHVLLVGGAPLALHQFIPFRRAGFAYPADGDSIIVIRVALATMRGILTAVGSLPGVTDGNVDVGGYLSYAMVDTVGGTIGFESMVEATNGLALFTQLAAALGAERGAQRTLERFDCQLNLRPMTAATDVSGVATVTMSGVRFDHVRNLFAARLQLTNAGGVSLAAPISVILNLGRGVELFEATGVTCRVLPSGLPYVDLLSSGNLAPGASLEKIEYFVNPNFEPIELQTRVVAGTGSR